MDKAEIRVIVTEDGVDRTEVLTPKSKPEIKDSFMRLYHQISFEIYQFRLKVNQVIVENKEGVIMRK